MCVSHSQNPTKENRNKREGGNEGKKEEEKSEREKKTVVDPGLEPGAP